MEEPPKFKRGMVIYRRSRKGRFLRCKVLSVHPHFSALTCARYFPLDRVSPNTLICAFTECIPEERLAEEKLSLRMPKLHAKYDWLIEAVEKHGSKDIEVLSLLTGRWPIAIISMLGACRRANLLPPP